MSQRLLESKTLLGPDKPAQTYGAVAPHIPSSHPVSIMIHPSDPHGQLEKSDTPHASQYYHVKASDVKPGSDYEKVIWNIMHENTDDNGRPIRLPKNPLHQVINGPLVVRFLKEPLGEIAEKNCKDHVEKIKAGEWTKLNFADPEFDRNLAKALRLEKITRNEWATVLFLHKAMQCFHDPERITIRQHDFLSDEKTYHANRISYITPEQTEKFYKDIKRLPPSEQCYFSINLSRNQEKYLLFGILNELRSQDFSYALYVGDQKKLKEILSHYILQCQIEKEEKDRLLKLIRDLCRDNRSQVANELLGFFNKHEVEWRRWYQLQDKKGKALGTVDFLSIFIRVDDQNPSVEISPDYDSQNSRSPLLSLILPSVSANQVLLKSVFGDDAVEPHFTLGQFTARYTREADEGRIKFGVLVEEEKVKPQRRAPRYRPIEVTHSDLAPQVNPHGINVDDFMLMWHDNFHCWRSSSNFDKKFFTYLRALFEKEKQFDMSKSIYAMTDLGDMSYRNEREIFLDYEADIPKLVLLGQNFWGKKFEPGSKLSEFDQVHQLFRLVFLKRIYKIFNLAEQDFWQHVHENDNAFLLLIDMIKNPETWREFLRVGPFKIDDLKNVMAIVQAQLARRCAGTFERTYVQFEALIDAYPNQSTEFYILAFHLKDRRLISLFKNLDLKKLLEWSRNGGLHFKSAKNKPLQTLSPQLILMHLYVEIKNQTVNPDAKTIFKAELAQYIIDREAEREKSKSEYLGFFKCITGTSATVKINAAAKLLDALDGRPVNFEQCDLDACNEWRSKLTDIVNRNKALLPKVFLDKKQDFTREKMRHGMIRRV